MRALRTSRGAENIMKSDYSPPLSPRGRRTSQRSLTLMDYEAEQTDEAPPKVLTRLESSSPHDVVVVIVKQQEFAVIKI